MISANWAQSKLARRFLPVTVLIILGMMWGGVPSIAKYVTQNGVSPLSYTFWILSIGGSILIIINFLRGGRLALRHLKFYFLCGLTGSAIPTTFMYYSIMKIPAGLMALIFAITPIFTYLIAIVYKVEKIHTLKTLGVILGCTGIALILTPNAMSNMSAPIFSLMLGISTPLFYAINIVYTTKNRPPGIDSISLSCGMLITAAVAMLVVVLAVEPLYPLWDSEVLISVLILYHGTLTATAFCMFYALMKYAGALFTSQVAYSVTLFGIAIGAHVYDEVLPLLVWVATGLIFAAVGFIQKARQLESESQV